MNKKIRIFVFLFTVISGFISAQKPSLDNSVYDIWKSISSPSISEDGKWITYIINPQQGDGWLYLYDTTTGIKDSVSKGTHAVFSVDSKFVAYETIPSYQETRKAKKSKLKEDEMPKNNLEVRLLGLNETTVFKRVKSFSVPEKNSCWMAYLNEKKIVKKDIDSTIADTSGNIGAIQKKKLKEPKAKGAEFVILNPVIKKEYRYQDVTDFVVAKEGNTISFLQNIPDTSKVENFKVLIFDVKAELSKIIFEGQGSVKQLSADNTGNLVSFIYSSDTGKVKIYDLWVSNNKASATKIVDSENQSMYKGWSVSENGSISFSADGRKIFFGTAQKPVKEPEDTLLDEEKYKLDIWSWNDDILQPMQKKQLDKDLKRNWLAVYNVDKKTMVQLADTSLPSVRTFQKGNNPIALGISDLKYRRSASWDGGGTADYYIVNTETGVRKLAVKGCSSQAYLSPSCKYLVYWDVESENWMSLSVNEGLNKNISSRIEVPLFDELNDVPDYPSPHGIAGWLDDEKHVFVYDRYDIWSLDLNGIENPVNITNSFGRDNNLRLRYNKLDPEADFINRKELMYLSAFNYENKESGFFTLKPGSSSNPVRLIVEKASFPGNLLKAKKANVLLWQKGTYTDYPELYTSNMSFGDIKKISITNPQQANYNWGTTELFEWISFDRQKLQGIIYKPEDFDPAKKYPLIVYFYERSSDGLYNYMPPAPSASIINRTFATSNEYIVFVPDIPYTIGYPGQSCYNAVVSGTYSLLDKFDFIDKDRMGLDGQSWGGYQIAWLVTQTDLFTCAYAGAAVTNMISAYGGIRWGSGMSRMFQYEHTQSRIGGTLWEKPVHYIENSPIFFVPKINTPLLLMHNDADGAVPWYQSIEFITALRRLEKPAWLLSYNDEEHNLMKRPNRKDISIRKMQFFDHYLKGAPMPYWMKNGISQLEKGKVDGYELVID